MRVLVTGGAGFIGTSLCPRLVDAGHEVRVLDCLSEQIHGTDPAVPTVLEGRVDFIKGDVRNAEALAEALRDTEAVVHLAAETGMGQSQYEISRYSSVNVQGQAELLQLMAAGRERPGRLVIASSCRIYGEGAYSCPRHGTVFPAARERVRLERALWNPLCPACGEEVVAEATREDALPNPSSIYAATKLAQEHLAAVFGRVRGVTTAVLRFQNVYGPGQAINNPYTGILSLFSARIRNGREPLIYEDGKPVRDFVYVDDVVRSIILSLESDFEGAEVFNIGTGRPMTISLVASLLGKSLGGSKASRLTGDFRVGDVRHCLPDLSKSKRVLGYEPTVFFEEGVREYGKWVLSQPKVVDGSEKAEEELSRWNLFGKAR